MGKPINPRAVLSSDRARHFGVARGIAHCGPWACAAAIRIAHRATPAAQRASRAGAQFIRQAQPAPPAPQPPEGWVEAVVRGVPTPTRPGLESSFARWALWQPGQEGMRSDVTNASNRRPQSWHEYSKRGMIQNRISSWVHEVH